MDDFTLLDYIAIKYQIIAKQMGLMFPELSMTGHTCADLFSMMQKGDWRIPGEDSMCLCLNKIKDVLR